MNDVKRVTEDSISKGGILFIMYFDSHGPSEDAVKNRLTQLFAKIAKEDGVIYAVGEIEKPIKEEYEGKEIYSTSGEIKVLAKALINTTRLALSYGPLYMEILEPEKRMIGFEELQEVMNDIAQTSYNLSQYIVQNTLKGDALKSFMRNVKYREELGKKLREGGANNEKKKD